VLDVGDGAVVGEVELGVDEEDVELDVVVDVVELVGVVDDGVEVVDVVVVVVVVGFGVPDWLVSTSTKKAPSRQARDGIPAWRPWTPPTAVSAPATMPLPLAKTRSWYA